jgi:hypothetical protein
MRTRFSNTCGHHTRESLEWQLEAVKSAMHKQEPGSPEMCYLTNEFLLLRKQLQRFQ